MCAQLGPCTRDEKERMDLRSSDVWSLPFIRRSWVGWGRWMEKIFIRYLESSIHPSAMAFKFCASRSGQILRNAKWLWARIGEIRVRCGFFRTLGVLSTSSPSPRIACLPFASSPAQFGSVLVQCWSNFVSGVEVWNHFNCLPRDTVWNAVLCFSLSARITAALSRWRIWTFFGVVLLLFIGGSTHVFRIAPRVPNRRTRIAAEALFLQNFLLRLTYSGAVWVRLLRVLLQF